MSIDEQIINALTPSGLPVVPNVYGGTERDYIVYNYDETPDVYGDNRPEVCRYALQVHLYMPHGKNPNGLKRIIRKALLELDGNAPHVVNASDSTGQHYSFELTVVGAYDG